MATAILTKVEAAWGANLANAPGTWTWTDITGDVRTSIGSIATGKSDEAAQSQPTTVTVSVNDPNGNYVPRNARGLNYPNVKQNTPLRITFATGVRAIVYADSYSTSWDESLTLPVVTISASGILRRLVQGTGQPKSPMRLRLEALGPVAYWPLEGSGDSTSGALSALSGGASMILNPSGGWTFGDSSHPDGASGSMRRATNTSTATGYLPSPAASSVRFDFAYQAPTTDATSSGLQVYNSQGWYWQFGLATLPADGKWHHHRLELYNSAGTATFDWYIDGVQINSGSSLFTSWQSVTAVKFMSDSNAADTDAVSHLAIYSPRHSSDTYQAFLGYTGETPTARLTRLCADEGVPLALTGTSNVSTMGIQQAGTFIDLARACEAADGGILTDGGSNGGLTYLARSARYNQSATFTLDNNLGQVARPFQPVEDDQRRRNYWTVSRTGAGTDSQPGVFSDTTGPQGVAAVGLYDDSTSLNVGADAQLVDQAAWRVHLGTVEAMRYPTVVLNLRAHPELVTAWLAAFVGARFTLKNLPSQHQPGDVDLVIEGWTEYSDGFQWLVAVNAGAYDPWRVDKVADAALGRLDTGGSTLNSSATAVATSLSVATNVGPVWVTSAGFPADFPFDIGVDGEQITVTAITGATSPQTFTVTRAINGVSKAHTTGAAVNIWHPGATAL